MTKNLTLEEFEKRRATKEPHKGRAAQFLLALKPLTPTIFEMDKSKPANYWQSTLSIQWRGVQGSVAVAPVMGGGAIRTSLIDGELYVVWYPEEK